MLMKFRLTSLEGQSSLSLQLGKVVNRVNGYKICSKLQLWDSQEQNPEPRVSETG